jgi:anti-sigma regulatory factor (Ser/Thr protein kinase)
MGNNFVSLHYDIEPGDYIKGGEASSNIKKVLMQLGISSVSVKKASIAAYEAEMNIVIHSYGGSLDIAIYKDQVQIKASDKGPGIDNINLAMTEGYSTASETAREMGFGGGMGLPNMKRSCDQFEISSSLGSNTYINMIIKLG